MTVTGPKHPTLNLVDVGPGGTLASRFPMPEVDADAHLAAMRTNRRELWLAVNTPALESSNSYVARYGLPLSRYSSIRNDETP